MQHLLGDVDAEGDDLVLDVGHGLSLFLFDLQAGIGHNLLRFLTGLRLRLFDELVLQVLALLHDLDLLGLCRRHGLLPFLLDAGKGVVGFFGGQQ